MKESRPEIGCSIFLGKEKEMKRLTNAINGTADPKEKAVYAQDLLKAAEELLSCAKYDKKSSDCKNCHTISSLRKETAQLVIKAGKLA
jgi:nitrate/TMAO reductase-like tetraheme cytochrome c subunit